MNYTTMTGTHHVVAVGKHRLARQWACEYIDLTHKVRCPVCGKVHVEAPYIYQEVEDKYDTPYEVAIWNDHQRTCSIECAAEHYFQHRDVL